MGKAEVVLAIDDNLVMLDMIKSMLAAQYDVRLVNSATNAISFLNNNHADIILLDIEMPNISGFDFLDDIRKIPSYMHVPIIIISGNTGQEFFRQARNSSAYDVLTKPVNKETLIKTIKKALAASVQGDS